MRSSWRSAIISSPCDDPAPPRVAPCRTIGAPSGGTPARGRDGVRRRISGRPPDRPPAPGLRAMDRAPMFVTLCVLAALLYGLIKDRPADLLFVGAVVLLAAFGVISPEEAFSRVRQLGDADRRGAVRGRRRACARPGVMDDVGERFLGRVETEGRALLVHGDRADPLGHGAEQHAQGGPAGARPDRLVPQAADLPLAAADAAVVPVDPGRAPAR